MDIKVHTTELEGVLLIEPKAFEDQRGFFFESYSARRMSEQGLEVNFVQDNHSRSSAGVIRGLHFQNLLAPQVRLVRCSAGAVFDVVVDIRVGSPTYSRWAGYELSASNRRQLLIPPQFAHGFAVLTDTAEVQYKCSGFHNPAADSVLAWNDPKVGIDWPIKEPILSAKDSTTGMTLGAYEAGQPFVFTAQPTWPHLQPERHSA
jgi:dTDP-4-dehydrorhamnose 3,5-epimerase